MVGTGSTSKAASRRVAWPHAAVTVLLLAGLALIVRAPASKLPLTFEVTGWMLVVTSLLIMVAPIRWHGAYGRLLLKWLTPRMLRILSPVPAVAGAGLIYAAL